MDDTSPPSAHRLAFFNLAAALAVVVCAVTRAAPTLDEAATFAFTDRYCSNCHNDVDREGGLDLTSLKYSPTDAANFALWVKVHDRVQAGEMPPKEKKRPNAEEQAGFVRNLASSLTAAEQAMVARDGRATERRLNRYEYQNALRDLLSAPWLQVMNQLPEDGEAFRFNKVSNALDVSYVHMTRYMLAADYALRQAMRAQLIRPETTLRRIYAREERGLTRWTAIRPPTAIRFPRSAPRRSPTSGRCRLPSRWARPSQKYANRRRSDGCRATIRPALLTRAGRVSLRRWRAGTGFASAGIRCGWGRAVSAGRLAAPAPTRRRLTDPCSGSCRILMTCRPGAGTNRSPSTPVTVRTTAGSGRLT